MCTHFELCDFSLSMSKKINIEYTRKVHNYYLLQCANNFLQKKEHRIQFIEWAIFNVDIFHDFHVLQCEEKNIAEHSL